LVNVLRTAEKRGENINKKEQNIQAQYCGVIIARTRNVNYNYTVNPGLKRTCVGSMMRKEQKIPMKAFV
jgi:hypothetical protein